MHVHEVRRLRQQWQASGSSSCRHNSTAAEHTVTGYTTGRVVCTTCGGTVGILPQVHRRGAAALSGSKRWVTELASIKAELERAAQLHAVASTITAAARRLAKADGATCILREGDFVHYLDENALGPLWKGKRFPASACISGWAILHGCTTVVPDIHQDARIPLDLYRPTFVTSLAITPVGNEAKFGAIGTYWKVRHEATTSEMQILHALAEVAAPAFQQFFS